MGSPIIENDGVIRLPGGEEYFYRCVSDECPYVPYADKIPLQQYRDLCVFCQFAIACEKMDLM